MTSVPAAGRPADVLSELLGAPLRAAGFDLEEIAVRRAGRQSVVAVTVDRDGALDLDAVAEASRIVSDALDAHEGELPGVLRDAYTLEVTSRGADAPLALPRHWRRATGRLVDIRLRDGNALAGRVVAVDEIGVVLLSAPKPHKPGARVSGKAPTEVAVAFPDVIRAVVQLEFTAADGDDELADALDDDASEEEV